MAKRECAVSIVELLVSVAVLVVLILLIARLFNSAAAVTTSGNKRMDAEAQIRPLFERMVTDFSQIMERSDVDYYLKSSANPQPGNDHIAFYSTVSGYYPCSTCPSPSPISIVAYRINTENKLERGAKQLPWNGASSTPSTSQIAMVFGLAGADNGNLPLTISNTWASAANSTADPNYYDLIGPHVIRFEYYYLLKNGDLSDTPWDASVGHASISGVRDVAAIVICIAAVDPKSKVLLDNSGQVASPNDNISKLAAKLGDYASGMGAGQLLANWQDVLDNIKNPDAEISAMSRPGVSAIRTYERYFYLLPK
jgi:hypothetical protein